jgi:hypothetical protein
MEAALAALGRFGIFSARVAWRSVTPPWNVHFHFGILIGLGLRRPCSVGVVAKWRSPSTAGSIGP